MKRAIFSVMLVLGLGATVLYAADFWVNKKFTDWSDKEVEKMVNNSPWAHKINVSMGGAMLGGPPPGGGGSRGGGGGSRGGGGGSRGGGGGMGGGGSVMPGNIAPSMQLFVRWVSALPVRQAIVRLRYGSEVSSPEAVKELQREESRYILSVAPLMVDMVRAQHAQLKSQASLAIKGKAPIMPSEVSVGLRGEGAAVYFFFPKEQNGQPLITSKDKEVQFLLNMGPMEIKRKFKLKNMVSNGGLAL